jgi:hypothetical protein
MKKFTVEIHYDASIYVDIEAEDMEAAEKAAMSKAYQDCPYDQLHAEVVYIEEQS